MFTRKHLIAAATVVLGCFIGISLPVKAQRGGDTAASTAASGAATAAGRGRGGGRGGAPGTLVSATYKGLTTDRAYQPMPTTAVGKDGKVVTTTYPAVRVLPITDQIRQDYRDGRTQRPLDEFYTKMLPIRGVLVIGSDKVSDWAFLECAYTLDHQFWHSPQWVRDGFAATKVRLAIIAEVEYTMDMPENRNMGNGAYNDRRSRGLGGFPWCSCAEENLLNLPADPYGGNGAQGSGENITIHEFTHTTGSMIRDIQFRAWAATQPADVVAQAGGGRGGRGGGGRRVDPPGSWGARMDAAFAKANAPGGRLYVYNQQNGGKVYASNDWQEYWAEGAQAWFDNANPRNSGGLSVRNDVKTKDPDLAALLLEIYGDEEWRYFKTTAKYTDGRTMRPESELAHLVGLDAVRAQFPRFSFNNSPRIIAEAAAGGGGGGGGQAGGGRGGRGGGNGTTPSAPTSGTAPATTQLP